SLISSAVCSVPPIDITAKDNPQYWQNKLKADLLPNGTLRLAEAKQIHLLPEYAQGRWWVQDVAASLPVLAMGNVNGLEVIDLCAAPGGKTAQLAARGAKVTALDISEKRLEKLQQNMQRLGFNNITTHAVDALKYLEQAPQQFDAVLLDAPCSATGTFRRHPEVLHIKNQQDVAAQVDLQKQMLSLCSRILRVGGTLLYSVCSICKNEGEYQIADFLKYNTNFKIVPITSAEISAYGTWNDDLLLPDGTIRTMPYYLKNKNGMDCFFICKMQRII
ncbi:MAG: RsmB/NOP family class I SAM-dependent RNA methyltransferase, partial [Alphaproteobacteria bacterium]|nr:RsmB/NOP family class I SAM-dependent RNA methyltransferase [Alphaproteobacteria bacterium]